MTKAVTTCYSARTLIQQLSGRHDIPLGYLIRESKGSLDSLIKYPSGMSSLPESCCVSVLAL
jgi:hypothetical protein